MDSDNQDLESQLLLTVNDFAETLNKGEQSNVVFLDFSKAYDSVTSPLICKLDQYGICGGVFNWIKNLTRSQQVIVDRQKSDISNVTSGVPQGTVLAPLLFLCLNILEQWTLQ